MAEYAATALSLTPIKGEREEVLRSICSYFYAEHEGDSPQPEGGRFLTIDARKRIITRALPMNFAQIQQSPEPDGVEFWFSMTATVSLGGRPDYINVYARKISTGITEIELWFPTSVHESIFDFDIDEIRYRPQAKSDFMRLLIGVARTVEADGFGLRFAKENSLFGPLNLEEIRDYVQSGDRWLYHKLKLIIAGLRAKRLEESRFKYDLDEKPMHYRRQGYYLYDILWPRGTL